MNKNFVPIGQIISSYGLKGEIKVLLYNKKSNILDVNFNVWLFFENKFNSLVIDSVKSYNKYKLIKFKSINDRTVIEGLKTNNILYISRSDLPTLDNDNFYLIDLIGLDVENSGLCIGKVIDVVILPTNNSLLILNSENCEFMIPMLDEFIELFDFDNNKIIVKNSEVFIK